jgi:hypothetical protein
MRTFSLYVHSTQSETPWLAFELASDEDAVQTIAERCLAESPNRLLVEVREDDRLVFTLDREGGLHRRVNVECQLGSERASSVRPD